MPVAGRFSIAANHPSLPGHFPGRPIVPGVVLLDHALALVEAACGAPPAALTRAKFFTPALPGDVLEVRYEPTSKGWQIHCLRGEDTVLTGALAADPPG